jgi:hypothetical protein
MLSLTFPGSFLQWQPGLPHPLNQTSHLDDRFKADRGHLASLIEVASKIFRRGGLDSQPGTHKVRDGFRLTLLRLPSQLAPIRPVFLIWTAKVPAVKVAKLVDKSRVLLLAGLVGIEQQLIAHRNRIAFPIEEWIVRHMNEPLGIAIDASGNLWVSNLDGNTVTEFLGLANPVKTPLLGPPSQP